jgi:hypothetical protein
MSEPGRKPNLLDVMTLIAALAIGLGLGRAVIIEGRPSRPLPQSFWWMQALQIIHHGTLACVLMLSLAFLIVRLRRPRPPRRDLVKQPGLVACLGAMVMPVTGFGGLILAAEPLRLSNAFIFLSTLGASGVVCGWGVLCLNRAWRPEPTWIDRLGRMLGLCWIGLPCLMYLSFLV